MMPNSYWKVRIISLLGGGPRCVSYLGAQQDGCRHRSQGSSLVLIIGESSMTLQRREVYLGQATPTHDCGWLNFILDRTGGTGRYQAERRKGTLQAQESSSDHLWDENKGKTACEPGLKVQRKRGTPVC